VEVELHEKSTVPRFPGASLCAEIDSELSELKSAHRADSRIGASHFAFKGPLRRAAKLWGAIPTLMLWGEQSRASTLGHQNFS
jgi:hypothetical protein